MSWNGHPVIDLDAHIVERADRFYREYLDPAYLEPYQQLCDAVTRQAQAGDAYSLFGSRTSIVEPIEAGRPLGRRDTFGLTRRSSMEGGRRAFPPNRPDALPPIRPEVSWDVKTRLEDMDRGHVDVNVLYPTHVSSYCALRDVGFENALYRAYHRWVSDFCAQSPHRLKWTIVANMRDVAAGVAEVRHWAERDPNAVGIYISPQAPEGKLLDNPDLYPLYEVAQALDLPLLAHGGTSRPPYGPGSFDLDGAWFLLHSFSNPWAGMAALGALVGGGILDMFPTLRVGIIETGGGWLPLALDRLDTHYIMSPGHVPNLKRLPRDVLAEGRYFHAIDTWERSFEFCVQELGEDLWLFASDWPHGDTAWPESVKQVVQRPGLTDQAKRKILSDNALRLCPRLRG
ncbi:MAG TPA: amidohydrolase family protein [Candidatus Methylomirabilis sp.]|nr:amidohydrolase family protein [Candidatus Methylomirabilis sp.]